MIQNLPINYVDPTSYGSNRHLYNYSKLNTVFSISPVYSSDLCPILPSNKRNPFGVYYVAG